MSDILIKQCAKKKKGKINSPAPRVERETISCKRKCSTNYANPSHKQIHIINNTLGLKRPSMTVFFESRVDYSCEIAYNWWNVMSQMKTSQIGRFRMTLLWVLKKNSFKEFSKNKNRCIHFLEKM